MASQSCVSKDVPYSRQETQCDYCGLKINRHNIKTHTQQAHPKQPVRERQLRQRPLDSMFGPAKKQRVEANSNEAIEVVENEKDETEINEIDPENEIYQHNTKSHDLMEKLKEIDSKVTDSFIDIKQEIGDIKKAVTPKVETTTDNYQNNALDNARTVSEICGACPEFEHHVTHKSIRCQLCVSESTFVTNVTRQVPGVIRYNEINTGERERDDLMGRDFRNVKIAIKKHLNGHIHNEHVTKVEQQSRLNQNRDNVRDSKAAALRCARLCYELYRKGRPFTDYPETVAAVVAGGTFMGETNHSAEFAASFLTSVAAVVREKITLYLKTPLLQTGFKPPVKIVADKDTKKHRTRQIIALTTFFPDAEELIQTLYISHPLVKHHTGEDIAEHLYSNLIQFLSADQYQGGSYDGAYFHQSVPKYLGEKFGVEDEHIQNDHDWLHKCGICEKNVRKKKENEWVTTSAQLCAACFNDFNYGKKYEQLKEIAEQIYSDFLNPKFHSQTRFANSLSNVFDTFYTDLPAIIATYRVIKEENINSHIQNVRKVIMHLIC